MNLSQHKEYQFSRILKVQANNVNKDRIVINLLPLIKYDGAVVHFNDATYSEQDVLQEIFGSKYFFENFSEHKDVVEKWITNDYMDFIHKDSRTRDKRFVSILPLTLNAYKVVNKKDIRDFRGSEQLWVMLKQADEERLQRGDSSVIQQLRDFLTMGYDDKLEKVHYTEEQDLATWMISSISNQFDKNVEITSEQVDVSDPLLCMAQARILADDIERLLQYRKAMSRYALLESLSQLFLLHIGIYVLRVAQMLPVAIERKTLDVGCGCNEKSDVEHSYNCRFKPKFQMDMQPNYSSPLSKVSSRNIELHEQQIFLLFESMLYVRKKSDFMKYLYNKDFTLQEIMEFDVTEHHEKCESYFKMRYESLQSYSETILDVNENYFEHYIAAIVQNYGSHLVGYYKRLLSSCFSKNLDRGIYMQVASHKKYTLGIEMLDTIMHIAMIEKVDDVYKNKVLRLDQFLLFLKDRYGFYIDELATDYDNPQLFASVRESKKYLTSKLQEIGYYQALSDAYNTQWLIPRYDFQGSEVNE